MGGDAAGSEAHLTSPRPGDVLPLVWFRPLSLENELLESNPLLTIPGLNMAETQGQGGGNLNRDNIPIRLACRPVCGTFS